jgi:hypothetical protein
MSAYVQAPAALAATQTQKCFKAILLFDLPDLDVVVGLLDRHTELPRKILSLKGGAVSAGSRCGKIHQAGQPRRVAGLHERRPRVQ